MTSCEFKSSTAGQDHQLQTADPYLDGPTGKRARVIAVQCSRCFFVMRVCVCIYFDEATPKFVLTKTTSESNSIRLFPVLRCTSLRLSRFLFVFYSNFWSDPVHYSEKQSGRTRPAGPDGKSYTGNRPYPCWRAQGCGAAHRNPSCGVNVTTFIRPFFLRTVSGKRFCEHELSPPPPPIFRRIRPESFVLRHVFSARRVRKPSL